MQATQFLIQTLFELYLMVALLRVWLQMAKADFYNPVSQFVVKATNPVIVPLRRIIPGFAGIDWAGVLLVFLISFAKFSVLQLMFANGFPVAQVAIVAAIAVVTELMNLIFWVMIIRAILSWVSQGYNPIEALLHQLTEPLLAPVRRFIPVMSGIDLSMIVFLIGLKFVELLFLDFIRMF